MSMKQLYISRVSCIAFAFALIDDRFPSTIELFKSWRREHASREFDLYEFPWVIPELDEAYKGQLLVR